jgi:hypothetical protein
MKIIGTSFLALLAFASSIAMYPMLQGDLAIASNQVPNPSVARTDMLIAKKIPRGLPRWVSLVPTSSRMRWLDQDNGIYLSRRGHVIGPYEKLRTYRKNGGWLPANLKGQQTQAHHLAEQRFSGLFGLNNSETPAVLLTQAQHTSAIGRNGIHSRINAALGRSRNPIEIVRAYKEAYRDNDDWSDALAAVLAARR